MKITYKTPICPACGQKMIFEEKESGDDTIYKLKCGNAKCPVRPHTSFWRSKMQCIKDWDKFIKFLRKKSGRRR